jgi:hypothetical protein
MIYGKVKRKIIIRSWDGRGTQLVKIADELLKSGYSTGFDAPAHKSPGNNGGNDRFYCRYPRNRQTIWSI